MRLVVCEQAPLLFGSDSDPPFCNGFLVSAAFSVAEAASGPSGDGLVRVRSEPGERHVPRTDPSGAVSKIECIYIDIYHILSQAALQMYIVAAAASRIRD
jgi:hypothetical protein